MDGGVERVSRGLALADEAGSAIQSLQDSSRQVLGSVEGITLGLNEQSSAARDIAQRVEQIAGASESNAASAARITHAARAGRPGPHPGSPFRPLPHRLMHPEARCSIVHLHGAPVPFEHSASCGNAAIASSRRKD
jgi:hypothetical protein